MIKINDFQENKDKLVVIFLIVVNLIFFYFCCIVPYNRLQLKRESIKKLEIKLKKIKEDKKIVEKVYENRINKNLEIEKNYNSYKEEIIKTGFKNINEFEKIIYEKMKKYSLYSQVIGRVEKLTDEKEGKVYISYEIVGREKNIKGFVKELESGEYLISLIDTPVYMERKEEEYKIRLKIAGYILNILEEAKKENLSDKNLNNESERIFIFFDDLNILEKKILNLNNKRYLLLKYKKGGRDIFCEDEEIEREGKKYKIKLKEDGIYLDSGEIR